MEKICYIVTDDADTIYYCEKLLNDKQYIMKKGISYKINLEEEYLSALYSNGQKKKFQEFYKNVYVNDIGNNPVFRLSLIRQILKDSNSNLDDYKFALGECQYLSSVQQVKDSNYIVTVYVYMVDTYNKLGDEKQAAKYSKLVNDKWAEIVKKNNTSANNK